MTRDEYINLVKDDPLATLPNGSIPPLDWIAEAWAISSVRDANEAEMARTVSKMGELFYTDEYLTALNEALTTEQQLRLFVAIRNESPHREAEFRPRFEQFFTRSKSSLPALLNRAEVIDLLGMDEESAREFLGE